MGKDGGKNLVPRSEWPFEEVLSDEHTRELETVDVYITEVEPRETKNVLSFASKYLPPLQKLEHCKRVRKTVLESGKFTLSLLLCQADAISLEDLQKLLKEYGYDQLMQPSVVPVSRHPPLNRQQYEAWKHLWPMTYREDTRQDPKFTQDDIQQINSHMQALFDTYTNISARVVDPQTNKVVAEAQDTREADGHPLHHAVMNCIDEVARIQLQDKNGRPKRKAMAIEQESDSAAEEDAGPISLEPGTKVAYLCTGLDMYTTHEPCAMCAMALVHSRIQRVFYSIPTSTGCLGTCYKIHSHSSLNHHYRVFKNVASGNNTIPHNESLDA